MNDQFIHISRASKLFHPQDSHDGNQTQGQMLKCKKENKTTHVRLKQN